MFFCCCVFCVFLSIFVRCFAHVYICKNHVRFSLRKSLFFHENSDLHGRAQQSKPRGQGINPQRSRDQAPYIKGSSLRSSSAFFLFFFCFFVYNDIEFFKFLFNSNNYNRDRAVAILLLLKIERILIQFMKPHTI